VVASVATYVLKNGPESLFCWRRLTQKGSRRETNKSVAGNRVGRRIKSAWSQQDQTRNLAIYAWAG
jgi:hypothetical protein